RTLAALSFRLGHPERSLGVLASDHGDERPSVARFASFVTSEFESLSQRIQKQEQNSLWRS
ncbi:MAG: LysR family transcriptional regulator, partial [Pseudomonadota bacterium]